ncbi:hypothetical protein GYB22_04745 [bacterium]|nr:hypothetical protein [bacterium]
MQAKRKPYPFKVSYYGNNLINPGVRVGSEQRVFTIHKHRFNKRKNLSTKMVQKQFYLNGNAGMFIDPNSHWALTTNLGLHFRHLSPMGHQFILGADPLGFYKSFLPKTYALDDGEIRRKMMAGNMYYAPGFSIGYGKFKEFNKNTGWFTQLNVHFLQDYNTGYAMPLIMIEFGWQWKSLKMKKRE